MIITKFSNNSVTSANFTDVTKISYFLAIYAVLFKQMFFLFIGKPGLLICKITQYAPFSGYAGAKQQTEKKQLRDVFQKGDLYFNSGDLLVIDNDNFIYFHDRTGDTFRLVYLFKCLPRENSDSFSGLNSYPVFPTD